MSKIEVNTVEPQCGTTLTLGGSGDTVALGSGASQTGFGRTGTVDWITTPKVTGDSPVTAVSGKGYFLNTTAGVITINLPAGSAGDIVSMADYAATWQTYNVTVAPNGTDKIGALNNNAILNTSGQSVTLVYVDGVQGWVNTMDSTSNVRAKTGFVTATVSGACNTLATAPCCADTKIATFVNPGTFCVSDAANVSADNIVSYMVIAGGGGGSGGGCAATTNGGGGGGAGGFRELNSPTAPYTASPLEGYATAPNRVTVTASPYPIVVGGGASAAPGSSAPKRGSDGTDSSFSTVISAGGGGGGCGSNDSPTWGNAGGSGGSGGGAGWKTSPGSTGGSGNTPPVTPPQGQDGGDNAGVGAGGGGGGVGGAGTGPNPPAGGDGGDGISSSISSAAVLRAGGGGGGTWNVCTGGTAGPGGGGAGGGKSPGFNGTVNTGGGGGGAGAMPGCCTTGGQGGSGIVIIRYKFQ